MRRERLVRMTGGWFIGNFEPSFLKTKEFEVAYKVHKKGDLWDAHLQKKSREINLLIRGRLVDCGREFVADDLWEIEPGEVSAPMFLEDCEVICVKTPSLPNDKVIVE